MKGNFYLFHCRLCQVVPAKCATLVSSTALSCSLRQYEGHNHLYDRPIVYVKSGESKKQVDTLFLDFKKAFDKVPHKKLIYKLQSCGLNLKVINWIRDFLNDRKQKVVLDSISLDMVTIASGVPQGSVIGPLLFIFYINDQSSRVYSKIRLFADVAVIYHVISDDTDA
jgi:hypothetical protein